MRPNDVAPIIGAASRGMIAAMMARLSARGFDGMTPAFAGVIPSLDANGARPSSLAQRAGVTKQAISQLIHDWKHEVTSTKCRMRWTRALARSYA